MNSTIDFHDAAERAKIILPPSLNLWRNVAAKAQAVLSESALLWAMFDVGYFLPDAPLDEWVQAVS
jgi:hypothetical protein